MRVYSELKMDESRECPLECKEDRSPHPVDLLCSFKQADGIYIYEDRPYNRIDVLIGACLELVQVNSRLERKIPN